MEVERNDQRGYEITAGLPATMKAPRPFSLSVSASLGVAQSSTRTYLWSVPSAPGHEHRQAGMDHRYHDKYGQASMVLPDSARVWCEWFVPS